MELGKGWMGLRMCWREVRVECWCSSKGVRVLYRRVGSFTAVWGWVGVSVFTYGIFTVQSVTVSVWLFTCEGTVSVSSGVVPVGPLVRLGCSNIGMLTHGSGHRFVFRDLGQRGLHRSCALLVFGSGS